MSLELPGDPIELAALQAEQSVLATSSDCFEFTPEQEHEITELELCAEQLDFLGQTYYVDARTGFSVLASFDATVPTTFNRFDQGVTFSGELVTYSHLHIGRILGANAAVRALCVTFDNVMLFPHFEKVEQNRLLHVPVLSVDLITQTS